MDPLRAAAGVESHPGIPTEQGLDVLRFLMDEAQVSFRCWRSTGQVDGHIGLRESTWDVVAALAILSPLGVVSTIDWVNTDLSAKLKYACGRAESPELVEPIIPYGSILRS